MEPLLEVAWISKLKALSDVARLIRYPLGSVIPNHIAERLADDDPTPEDLAELAGRTRPARRLFRALTDPSRKIPVRCPERRRRGLGSEGTRQLAVVYDQRLATVETERGPQLPSGWRATATLLVDLDLLGEEEASGMAVDCDTCGQTHLLDRSHLMGISSQISPSSTGTGPLPDGYPHVETAAFAELWGTFSQEEMSKPLPDIYLELPPSRDEAYRRHFAGNPAAITGQYEALAAYKQRVVDGLRSGNLTLTAPPSDPAQRVSDPPAPRVATVGSDPDKRLPPNVATPPSPSCSGSRQAPGRRQHASSRASESMRTLVEAD